MRVRKPRATSLPSASIMSRRNSPSARACTSSMRWSSSQMRPSLVEKCSLPIRSDRSGKRTSSMSPAAVRSNGTLCPDRSPCAFDTSNSLRASRRSTVQGDRRRANEADDRPSRAAFDAIASIASPSRRGQWPSLCGISLGPLGVCTRPFSAALVVHFISIDASVRFLARIMRLCDIDRLRRANARSGPTRDRLGASSYRRRTPTT